MFLLLLYLSNMFQKNLLSFSKDVFTFSKKINFVFFSLEKTIQKYIIIKTYKNNMWNFIYKIIPIIMAVKKAVTKTSNTNSKVKKIPDSVKKLMEKMNKDYGEWALTTVNQVANVSFQSTGVPSLDFILWGGLPKGRIIEFFWPESSGKTSLALQCIAEAQRRGEMAMLVDMEHAFDRKYAENLGIDNETLIHAKPDTWEQAFKMIEEALCTGEIKVIVLDSVAALVTEAELSWDVSDIKMAPIASLMSKALRRLTGLISNQEATLILINQVRNNIGVMFGNPEITTGGKAIKFYCSQRIRVSAKAGGIKSPKNKEEVIGNEMTLKVEKNKVAPPQRKVTINFYFKWGFDKIENIILALKSMWVVKQAGSYYSLMYHGEEIKAPGLEKFTAKLKELDYDELYKFFQEKLEEYNKGVENGTIDDTTVDTETDADELDDLTDDMDELSEE